MEDLERLSDQSRGSPKKSLVVRATGRFYTHELIGEHLVQAVLKEVKAGGLKPLRVVEPFCGDGRLVCRLVEAMCAHRGRGQVRPLEIHLWDCDQRAVASARKSVEACLERLGLRGSVTAVAGNSFEHARDSFGSFDVCITNPPWEVLKPDRREIEHLSETAAAEYVRILRGQDELLGQLYPLSAPQRKFSGWGTNLARCGTEASLRLVRPGGVVGVVSPASLVADQMSESLRRWLFERHRVSDLAYYVAEGRFFDGVDQPCITFVAVSGEETENPPRLSVYNREHECSAMSLDAADWSALAESGFVLPLQFGLGLVKLNARLRGLRSFAELESAETDGLWAGRELDETGHERFLNGTGAFLFVKGRMVRRFGMAEEPSKFVSPEGPKIPRSANYHRIAWRDVARPNQKRRVHATIIPPGQVTGNSLGVAYYRDDDTQRLKALLGIVNSLVFEAQARTYLATAHVSLGAVRQVRVPAFEGDDTVSMLCGLVDRVMSGEAQAEVELEVRVALLYGLSREDFSLVLTSFDKLEQAEREAFLASPLWTVSQPPKKGRKRQEVGELKEVKIPNHYAASLSKLDMQIVNAVPVGGNWKDVPESVPSDRLKQIRKSFAAGEGSRSTYYGRLKPDAPSYTINTYFARPGNGCHIHYEQRRTLSQREAARLQSFPDSFVFIGGKGAVATQIGNAVPPLLAFQIAKHLPVTGNFVDLFAGAGGLALGFTWAGWRSVVANDIDEPALASYRHNIHPETVCGDICDKAVFDAVAERCLAAKRASPKTPFFVLGGPPCQGFSTAGNRRSMDDGRNWLFKQYKALLELVKPDGFVFENVTGLLNMEGGEVFRMIHAELQKTTEKVHMWKLRAEEYAVPQRRTRVVLFGTRDKRAKSVPPPRVTQFNSDLPLFQGLPLAVSVGDALGDLPPLEPSEDGSAKDYLHEPRHPYQAFMRGCISADEFLEKMRSLTPRQSASSLMSALR